MEINNFLDLTIKVYQYKSRLEIDRFFDCFEGKPVYNIKGRESREIWFWGSERWGKQWSDRDCELRETLIAEYYKDKK